MINIPCFECANGFYETILRPYETTGGNGQILIIENVPHEICDKCGDICFSMKARRMIETARKESGVIYKKHLRHKE
jgi:YgiT-type zinc finger domain-containing protein